MNMKLHNLEGQRSVKWRKGRQKRDTRKEKIPSVQVERRGTRETES